MEQNTVPSVRAELMRPKQVSEYLSTPVNVLQNWRAQGTGPAYVKVTNSPKAHVRYLRADVDAWLASLPRFEGRVEKNAQAAHDSL